MHVNVCLEMFSLTRTIHMQEMLTCFFRTPFCLCLMSAASDYEYRDTAMESVDAAGESGRGRRKRILVDTDFRAQLEIPPLRQQYTLLVQLFPTAFVGGSQAVAEHFDCHVQGYQMLIEEERVGFATIEES